ncbi:MAP kinase [Trichosporon asahii var. asahii CBS 2479]|uniref:Mitogen-activated protein kinase n=1 Tax=Trichosporon asahii var. asahii (strain ATCC 90039 / CBS 2479 / JCM 2466 / KCTC 7840 / NBRC 103889/ NCYC 2677 / UAMH 7654) TaxID=1186058 RepID=J4UF51_TRIAS|nr:MAP kinase [Trichosporon asahii var. asahii CBS 2479]EJT49955.1 MAP kinase [Trichosporon asahii var. asahii CBS 2479]
MPTAISPPASPAPPSTSPIKAVLPRRAKAVAAADGIAAALPSARPQSATTIPATTASLTTGSTAASSEVPSPAELESGGGPSNTSASGSGEARDAGPGELRPSGNSDLAVPNVRLSPASVAAGSNTPASGAGSQHAASAVPTPVGDDAAGTATSTTASGRVTPATTHGASMLAQAARRGMVEEDKDEHPLSDRKLAERGYHTIHAMNHLFHVPDRWRLLRPLGQGAYGLVVSVQDTVSGEPVAIKCITRVFDKPILARRALREITLLRHFGEHENLTGLIDLDNVWDGYNEIYLYMEPMEADLHQIVRSGQPLSNLHIQFFLYQLLRGVKYIHSANVIHRDLKPGNLLVNSDCELKICDFGLARGYQPVTGEAPQNEELRMTEYVATRWYRAPEIMLSNKRYTSAIDVWSIGCILGELLGLKPLFKGKDYVDQLNLILNVLGTPDDETLQRMSSEKARMYMATLPHSEKRDLAEVLPGADPAALDLLAQLLSFDPSKRIDVVQALEHPYVGAYHDPSDEPTCEPFNQWEQVEGLETTEELKAALTKEIIEYRAEVRGMAEQDMLDELEQQRQQQSQHLAVQPSADVNMSQGKRVADEDLYVDAAKRQVVEDSDDEDSPVVIKSKLGLAAQAGRSPRIGGRKRLESDASVRSVASVASAVSSSSGASVVPGSQIVAGPRHRRSSSRSSVRRSMSLFGTVGGMAALAMTAATPKKEEEDTASEGIYSSMVERRNRAASNTTVDSLRPLIRHLSTTSLADLGIKSPDALTDDEPLIRHSPHHSPRPSGLRRGRSRSKFEVGEPESA